MLIPVSTERAAAILGTSTEKLSPECLVLFTTCKRLYLQGIEEVLFTLDEWMFVEEHL